MLLSREQFLDTMGLPSEKLFLPHMGGEVLVQGLTLGDHERLVSQYRGPDGGIDTSSFAGFRAAVIVRCLVDEDGRRLLTNEDVARIEQKSTADMGKIYDVAARLSGFGPEGVETAQKNSDAPADAFSSDLP